MIKYFTVAINDKVLPEKLYSQYSVIGDIDDVYNYGGLVINDTTGAILDISSFKIGDPVQFTFSLEDGSTTKISYAILSITSPGQTKPESSLDTLGDSYIFKLIGPAFFKQVPANRGYFKSTSSIIADEMDKIKLYFNKVNISSSDDSKSRRYLLNERPLSFIKDISKKCLIQGEAALCFTDEKNNFNFTSYKLAYSQAIKLALVAPQSTASTASGVKRITMSTFSVKNFEEAVTSWDTLKPTLNGFNPANNSLYVKSTTGYSTEGSILVSNPMISSLPFTSQIANPLYGFAEQKAMFQKEIEKQIYNYVIEVEALNCLDLISCGDTVSVSLKSTVSTIENSMYSGKYVVKRCEHRLYDGTITSKLTLVSPLVKKPTWYKDSVIEK